MKLQFQAFKRIFVFAINWRKQEQDIYGWTNRCENGKYIITLDYDHTELEWIKMELKELQEAYGLSSFYIFKTNNGYHAVCPDKVPLVTFVDILKNSTIDPNYANVPLRYGKRLWTLRWSEKNGKKPEFINILPSPNCSYTKSKAHILLLGKLYPEIIFDKSNEDESSKIILSNYKI